MSRSISSKDVTAPFVVTSAMSHARFGGIPVYIGGRRKKVCALIKMEVMFESFGKGKANEWLANDLNAAQPPQKCVASTTAGSPRKQIRTPGIGQPSQKPFCAPPSQVHPSQKPLCAPPSQVQHSAGDDVNSVPAGFADGTLHTQDARKGMDRTLRLAALLCTEETKRTQARASSRACVA